MRARLRLRLVQKTYLCRCEECILGHLANALIGQMHKGSACMLYMHGAHASSQCLTGAADVAKVGTGQQSQCVPVMPQGLPVRLDVLCAAVGDP